MSEANKNFLHHLAAALRDIVVVFTVIIAVVTFVLRYAEPYWKPFADLPAQVLQLQQDVVTIRKEISNDLKPEIVDFIGTPQVITNKEIYPGDAISILYFLKRNASCETTVFPRFLNVDTNIPVTGESFRADQAPVSSEPLTFPVTVALPKNIPPGRYVYVPRILALNCGVYKETVVPPTTIFVVKPKP